MTSFEKAQNRMGYKQAGERINCVSTAKDAFGDVYKTAKRHDGSGSMTACVVATGKGAGSYKYKGGF